MLETINLIKGEKGFELEVANKENWVLLRHEGYSPVQSLVAAVGACGGYVYDSILTNSSIPHEILSVEASYTRNETNKVGELTSISVVFKVTVPEEFQRRATSSVKMVGKFCPVIQTLNCEVLESVEFVE